MPTPTAVDDQEALDLQLASEAKAERDAEKSAVKDKKPWEKAAEEDHPELKEPEEKQEAAEEEEKVEEPAAEKQPESEKKAEEIKTLSVEDKAIQDWGIKHNLNPEEAKDDYEKTKSIVGKYKSPEEMARALRLTQSERDKLKNETPKQEQPVIRPAVLKDPRTEINQYVAQNADKLIAEYKRNFPSKSEILTEEAILEEVADKVYSSYQNWATSQQETVRRNAAVKRDEALNSLKEEDRAFIAQIKPVLIEMSDEQVLANDFNIGELVAWAKGKNIQKLIAEAEERGYKRAKAEGSKILGQIPQSNTGTKSTTKKPSGTVSLSSYDKTRALEMYEGTTMTDEEKLQAFAELKAKKKS